MMWRLIPNEFNLVAFALLLAASMFLTVHFVSERNILMSVVYGLGVLWSALGLVVRIKQKR